jgi:hypothetical protein
MQLMILAHALDGGAQAVANILAPALGYRLKVMRPEWLAQAHWSQRLGERGISNTLLSWHGDHRLESKQICFVWNRIRLLPQAAFRSSNVQDRDYAGAELQALVASWLAELGNRVEPSMRRHASVTPVLHHLHWAAIASRCGLALSTGSGLAEDFSVLRTPIELWGSDTYCGSSSFVRACDAMATELGFALLSMGFRGTPTAPFLCRVDAHPALTSAGEIQAVARWLSNCLDPSLSSSPRNMKEALT